MKRRISMFLLLAVALCPFDAFAEADNGITLTQYDGRCYSVMLPQGWEIAVMGQYSAFAFRAWNPENPAYEIFYYCSISPLMKSEAAREWNASYAAALGEGSTYQFFADSPAIDIYDVSTVFYAFPDIGKFVRKYGGSYLLPGFTFSELRNFALMGTVPMQTLLSSACVSEGIVYGSLQSDAGDNCYGCFSASIWAAPSQFVEGIDQTPAGAMKVTGVIAPQADFNNVQNILTQAVFSLTFTQEYIDEANIYANETGSAALAANAERQAMFENYCDAWNEAFRN